MSGNTSNAAHGGAHGAHDDHGHGHAGIDPMKMKIGLVLGGIIFTVVLVTVFSYANMPASAQLFGNRTKEPVILPPQTPAELTNSCDNALFEYLIIGWNNCR